LDARAATGVYFGETSQYNVSSRFKGNNLTNQVAELVAATRALDKSLLIQQVEIGGSEVTIPLAKNVIKTDSEYVVKGMTEWVFKWQWLAECSRFHRYE
jgi:ribonuclease HI